MSWKVPGATAAVVVVLMMPVASGGYQLDTEFGEASIEESLLHPVGHYAWAATETSVKIVDGDAGYCYVSGEYEASAGPIVLDPGGAYYAAGWGDVVPSDSDAQSYPFSAHVEEGGADWVRSGTTVDTYAEALAQSPNADDASADDDSSARCTV